MKDRYDDPLHHERMLLPECVNVNVTFANSVTYILCIQQLLLPEDL